MRCAVIVVTGLVLILLMEIGYSLAIQRYDVRQPAAKASNAFFRGPIATTLASLAL